MRTLEYVFMTQWFLSKTIAATFFFSKVCLPYHRTWSLYAPWAAWSWSTIRSQTAIAEDIFLQLKSIQMMTSFPVLSTLTTLKEKVVLLPGHFWSLMILHIVVYIYMWNRLKWTILCRICSDYHWIQQICKASLMKQKTSRPNFKKKNRKRSPLSRINLVTLLSK